MGVGCVDPKLFCVLRCLFVALFFFPGIVVTNDGNAILRELDVAHPAAKVLFFFSLS